MTNSRVHPLLKFDKCKNYPLIAEACIETPGPYSYQNGGSLNTKTLFDQAMGRIYGQ